jgi:hypothetical protein
VKEYCSQRPKVPKEEKGNVDNLRSALINRWMKIKAADGTRLFVSFIPIGRFWSSYCAVSS